MKLTVLINWDIVPAVKNTKTASEDSNMSRRRKAALIDGGAEYTAKRDEIVHLAVELFREKGYKSTTLNDIATSAGLDRATLYYYIGSKEELFQEAVKGVLDGNIAEAERLLRIKLLSPQQKLEKLFEKLMASYEENYPHTYVYIQEQMQKVGTASTPWQKEMVLQTKRFENIVIALIKQGISQGTLRNDIPVELAANTLFGMFNWSHRWHKPGGKYTAKMIAEAFCKIFFEGMHNGPPQVPD